MAFEHEPGTISVFKNQFKDNDKQPAYRGKGLLEVPSGSDIKVEVSLWINEKHNGEKFFGGYIKEDTYVPKENDDAPKAATTQKAAPKKGNPFDDDIPF